MALRLGTRGSALAVAQSSAVARAIEALGEQVELVEIVTSGDKQRAIGDKGRFVKEIEQALLDGEIDLAVHSAKDVPGQLPDGLEIAGVPGRADPRDALCGVAGLDELPAGAVVGTASLRRQSQLLAVRPDLKRFRPGIELGLTDDAKNARDGEVVRAPRFFIRRIALQVAQRIARRARVGLECDQRLRALQFLRAIDRLRDRLVRLRGRLESTRGFLRNDGDLCAAGQGQRTNNNQVAPLL